MYKGDHNSIRQMISEISKIIPSVNNLTSASGAGKVGQPHVNQ